MAMRSENDFAPNHQSTGHSRHEPSRSRQLDFHQAMSDFKHMFPEMDEEVIEAVLRANSGAVDATIDQLLTMNIDNEQLPNLSSLQLFKDHKMSKSLEEPPPYSEAIKSNPPPRPARTRPPCESPRQSPKITQEPQPNLLDLDIRSFSSTLAASENTTPKTLISKECQADTTPRQPPRPRTKKPYKHYNPPLLGALPDDFLRLTPPNVPQRPHRSILSITPNIHQSSSILHRSSSGVNRSSSSVTRSQGSGTHGTSSHIRSTPSQSQSHRSHHLSNIGRSQSQVTRHHSAHHHDRADRHRITPADRSRSMIHRPSTPPTLSSNTNIAHATRSPNRSVTHEISSLMLQRKLKENTWRRKSGPTCEEDPDMVQYLDDERMAIILQNREFLQELREDKDFMDTLNQDLPDETEAPPEAPTVNTSPLSESQQEGYGEDMQDSLGAFPFTTKSGQIVHEDDAELRKRLANMGKASKTHFASIAKKFFTIRRKRMPKPLTRDTVTPSMMNLLDEDYSNGDTNEADDRQTVESLHSSHRHTGHQLYRPRISTADTSHSSVI